ncbi:hypothetical protein RRG08_018382 [Elysia crispata]|uniref:Uncharacterized protein n=1 Tax=Elysia crispata TaxID=231223 RepID=A0AAE0YMV1_9GAST|nr:hypothetical protein RRG08_018382 [Elysia crispata]
MLTPTSRSDHGSTPPKSADSSRMCCHYLQMEISLYPYLVLISLKFCPCVSLFLPHTATVLVFTNSPHSLQRARPTLQMTEIEFGAIPA